MRQLLYNDPGKPCPRKSLGNPQHPPSQPISGPPKKKIENIWAKQLSSIYLLGILGVLLILNANCGDATQKGNTSKTAKVIDNSKVQSMAEGKPQVATKYKIVKYDLDSIYMHEGIKIIRKVVRISVPFGLSRKELDNNLKQAAWAVYNKQKCNAVMVFAYREGDKVTGVYTAGRVILAPNGKWEDGHLKDNKMIATVELSDLYFKKEKTSDNKAKHIILLGEYKKVGVSNKFNSWMDEDIIVRIPNGTKAEILEVKKQAVSSNYELTRYRIKVKYKGKIYIGWVHDFDTK